MRVSWMISVIDIWILVMVSIIFLNTLIIYGVFNYNLSILQSLSDTPIYQAFQDPTFVYVGLILNISTSGPTLLDIFLDAKFYHNDTGEEIESNTLIERFLLSTLNITTGLVVLLLRKYENIPYIYACVHAVQFVGSMGMVLLICKRLLPKLFTNGKILSVQILFSLASMTSMMGFGHSIAYWSNIATFFLIFGFFYCFMGRIAVPWLFDLRNRISIRKEVLSAKELCALWYFMSTLVVIIVVPGIVATIKLYDWSNFNIVDVNVFVYSFAMYGIIISTIPGRVARFSVNQERKNLVESKRALIRYFSHEVRSPLNVICSGLSFLLGDISKLPASIEKTNLLETVTSIRQASEDVVKTTNDLLQLESMDSAAFSIAEEMVPCSELSQLATACSAVAREKGISFAVNNEFERLVEEKRNDDEVFPDIEIGISDAAGLPSNHPNLSVFIDKHKIGQVIRNLITNSVKFTPEGQSISVNIRLENTAADLVETGNRRTNENGTLVSFLCNRVDEQAVTTNNKFDHSFAGLVTIEVADTGVGIAAENWSKVFGQFQQFNPNKLQGGGGSGLGLWICQNIVTLHSSEIRFHSSGEGCGTRFYFTLPCYSQVAPLLQSPLEVPTAAPSILSPSLPIRAAQISPELPALPDDKEPVAVEISHSIAPPRLSTQRICKVLVVDDSRPNVKIVIRLINQASALRPYTTVGNGYRDRFNEATEKGVGRKQVVVSGKDRSNTYGPSTTVTTTTDDVAVKFVYSEASDGTEAVRMVHEASEEGVPFDAVFMDNIMHVMHGPQAAQVMRSAGYEGLIIGVTGNVMDHDVRDYIQHGADHVMGKPVQINELREILEKIV